MDNRTRDDQHRLLRTYFSPGVVANVEKGTTRNESRGAFLRLVRYHAVRAMSYNVTTMPAANIRSFNLAIRPVFHATISARIAANLTGFDSIAGIGCADDFISWRTVGHWVECFTETFLASTPTQFTQSSVSSDPSAYGQSSSAATSVGTSPKHGRYGVGQLDGAGDDSRRQQIPTTSLLDIPSSPVEQVTLRGPTLLQAWLDNPVTRRLSQKGPGSGALAHDPMNLDSRWTPATAGHNYVYHGTSCTTDSFTSKFNNRPFNALEARQNTNQMSIPVIGVIFTAFSPLRSFLWGAFQGAADAMAPSAASFGHADEVWSCGGRRFKGVPLFQFSAQQPAPSNLSYHIIPEDQAEEWGEDSLKLASQKNDKSIPLTKLWPQYTKFHGQKGDREWPDIVHGVEYGKQKDALQPFRTNMWRTIWKEGPAVNHLNANHRATFAITVELVPGTKPDSSSKGESSTKKPPPKDGDDDDDQPKGKKKKDRFKTLRGLRQKVSESDLGKRFKAWSNRSTD
ncbi:hypothetical protein K4K57_003943 [Colletotrichum sp. SAR 10_99]|nr:hypothetical protein K4K57_003943 [Colletotrichum sp. SAR 10_99]